MDKREEYVQKQALKRIKDNAKPLPIWLKALLITIGGLLAVSLYMYIVYLAPMVLPITVFVLIAAMFFFFVYVHLKEKEEDKLDSWD